MKLSLAALLVCVFATVSLSEPLSPKPHVNCRDPYYAGFEKIPGIASLCNNAVRPTTTVTQGVTGYVTSTRTVIVTNYRYTDYHFTTPTPTATRCPTSNPLAAGRIDSGSSAGLILTMHAPDPTGAAVVRRDDRDNRDERCKGCLPVAKGITSACSCFFSAGPQQTVTRNTTLAVSTLTTTTTSTVYLPRVRTRTLAVGCYPTLVPVYGSAGYAVCGSQGIPGAQLQECRVPTNRSAPPFDFDAQDCCTACADTLDCFQGFTDPFSNTCSLYIRTGSDGTNTNVTTGCPNFHTYVKYGDFRPETYASGLIPGHCAQGC